MKQYNNELLYPVKSGILSSLQLSLVASSNAHNIILMILYSFPLKIKLYPKASSMHYLHIFILTP